MTATLSDVLLLVAFVLVIVSAVGRAPLWPAVLLVVLSLAAARFGR